MTDDTTETRMFAISERVAVVMTLSRSLSLEDVDEWAAHARAEQARYDTLGPILDPTGWQRDHEGREHATRVALAFAEFRRACEP